VVAHSFSANCQPAYKNFHGETAISDDNPRRPFVRQIPPEKDHLNIA